MDKALALVGRFTLVVALIIFGGWIFTIMWALSILPTFPTMPRLTIAQGVALCAFATYMKARRHTKEDEETPMWKMVLESLVMMGLCLLIAWLANLAM